MVDILLDASGDLDITGSKLKLCPTLEQEVRQKIHIVLNINKGEWDYNLSFGTPWLENDTNKFSILGKVPVTVFNSEIKKQILSVSGVKELVSYDLQFDHSTRQGVVNVVIKTVQGTAFNLSEPF